MRWHRAFVVSAVVVLAGCPDKNNPERRARAALAKFEEFTNEVCQCKDKACADHVQDRMMKWANEMAKESGNKEQKPDEETMKKMSELGQRYGDCMTKAMSPSELAKPELPPRDDIPPATTSRDADSLVRAARTWARDKQPEHFLNDAQIDYVDAKGTLDDKYGRVEVTFGRRATTANDANRKIGAPVEKPTAIEDCFQLTWTASQSWSRTSYACADARDLVNRCSVVDTWKKAIAKGAPPAGLARIEMNFAATGHMWTYILVDEPRGIDIREAFADDCPLAVEK